MTYPGPPAGPPQWGPPPQPYGQPQPGWGAPPPPPKRSGAPVGVIIGAVAVVALVGLVTTVLVVRALSGDDGGSSTDFGAGPRSEPEEAWSVDLDGGDEVSVLSDGDQVYALVSTDDEDFDTTVVVTAFAADDGEELWSESVGSSGFDEPLRVLDDGQVLLVDVGDETTTRLLDGATGDEVWQADGEPSDAQASVGIGPILDVGRLDPLYLTVADEDSDEETVVAVDRASGDELWDADGGDALPCGDDAVITYTDGGTDDESFTPRPGEVVVRDADTGDERWSQEAYPGFCSGGHVPLGTAADEVTVFDVGSGEERSTIELDGVDDGFVYSLAFGDHVSVSQITFDDEGGAYAAIFPIDGGEPTWEGDDSFAFPVGRDVVLVGDEGGSEATLVRARDGEELGEVSISTEDNDCDGAISSRTILVCATDSPEVTSYSLEDGLDEVWTVDAGVDAAAIAVGGDTLFVVGDDALVALR